MLMANEAVNADINSHPTSLFSAASVDDWLRHGGEGFRLRRSELPLYAAIGFSVMIEALNQLAIFNRRQPLADARQRATEAVSCACLAGREDADWTPEHPIMLVDHGNQQIFNPQERRMIGSVILMTYRQQHCGRRADIQAYRSQRRKKKSASCGR